MGEMKINLNLTNDEPERSRGDSRRTTDSPNVVKVWRAGAENQSVHRKLSALSHKYGVGESPFTSHQVQLKPCLSGVGRLDNLGTFS